jgi:protein TonB
VLAFRWEKSRQQTKTTWIELAALPRQKPKDKNSQKNRIVQTSPAEKVEKPEPDSYLSWQNQQVDRATVSKNKRTVIGEEQKANKNSSLSKNNVKNSSKVPPPLSKLGVAIAQPEQKKMDQPQWASPGARPEDYIEGLAESDRTALSTREYVFYGYFQRIRERLDRAWVPILREKLIAYYRTGRQLAGSMSHTTKVIVVLDEKGEIVRVELVSESGTRDLDDAAVNAFNRAGPFPNPPKGIIDTNRQIRIPWDFVLNT